MIFGRSNLQRASFRRSSGGLWQLFFTTGVGVISGVYIFKSPLEEFWSDENKEQRPAKFNSTDAAAAASSSPIANDSK